MTDTPTILYTYTDEAPALATFSLLPILQAYAGTAGVTIETRDISLAGRILANFNDYLIRTKNGDAISELVAWQNTRGEHYQTPQHRVHSAIEGCDW